MTDLRIKEAAAELGMSPEALIDWLRDNPIDRFGKTFAMGARSGRTFTTEDVGRIAIAMVRERATVEASPKPNRNGWVYFIEGGDWIKIGFTRSGRERLKKMATDAPVELRFLHAEPGTFQLEKSLHDKFADLRTRGEWFCRHERILAHIEQRKQIVGDILDQVR